MSEIVSIGNYAIEKFIGYGASSAVFRGYDLNCHAHGVSKNVAIKFIWKRDMALDEVRRLEQTQSVFEICDLITYDEITGAEAREKIGSVIAQLEKAIGQSLPIDDDSKIGVLVLKLINGEHLIDRTIYRDETLDSESEWLVEFEHPEYAEKIALKEWLTPVTQALDLEQRLDILLQLAKAIDQSHRRGVVHGDLNPWNVFFEPDTGRISIIDLGRNNFGVQGWRTPEHLKLMSEELERLPKETDIRLLGQWMRCLLPSKGPWTYFIEKCYAEDPRKRPSTKEIIKALKSYLHPAPKRRWLAAAALFSITVMAVVYAWRQHTPFSLDLDSVNRIAVLPYAGAASGSLVAEMVTETLNDTNLLNAIQKEKALDVAKAMDGERLAKSGELQRVAVSLGAEFVLVGIVEQTETGALTWNGALYQRDGLRKRLSAAGASPLTLADNIAQTTLKALGSNEIPLPTADFYSPDLQANFAYSYGNDFLEEGNINAALPMYEKALEFDPQFHWARAKMAFSLFKRGDLEASEATLLDLIENPDVLRMPQLLAQSYAYLAYIARYSHDYELAMDYIDNAKAICEERQLNDRLAHLYTLESYVKSDLNLTAEAELAADIADELYGRIDDNVGRIKNLVFEVAAAENRRELDLAREKLDDALAIARQHGLESQEALLLQKSARLDLYKPESEIGPETLEKLHRARELQEKLGDAKQLLNTELHIAKHYRAVNEFSKSLAIAQQVHQRAKAAGISAIENNAAFLAADLADSRGDLDQAELYLAPLVDETRVVNETDRRDAYSRLWRISVKRGNFELAKTQLEKSLFLAEQSNHQRFISFAYNNLGEVLEMQREYDKATNYYLSSLRIKRDFNDQRSLNWTLRNLVMVSLKQGELTQAAHYMDELLQFEPLELQSKIVLARLQYEQGAFRQALSTMAACRNEAQEKDRWTSKLDQLYNIFSQAFQQKQRLALPEQFANWL